MKGLVFFIAFALACCVATCGALKCHACVGLSTREDCLNQTKTDCGLITISNPVCMTTYQNITDRHLDGWYNNCSPTTDCDTAEKENPQWCKPSGNNFKCVSCCDTDGCVGDPVPTPTPIVTTAAPASAARVSIVAMATAALAVLMKNAAGF